MLTLYLAATTGLTLTGFLLVKIVELKNQYEEEQLKIQLSLETAQKREREAKEKLYRAKGILQSIAQEFLMISSTVDWVDKLSPVEFQQRYQDLWDKTAEAQMLIAFYAPTLKESAENLDSLLNNYWRKLYWVLVGEQAERTTQDAPEIGEYSQLIVAKISVIKQKLVELIS